MKTLELGVDTDSEYGSLIEGTPGRSVKLSVVRLEQSRRGIGAVGSAEGVKGLPLTGETHSEDRSLAVITTVVSRAVEIPVTGLDESGGGAESVWPAKFVYECDIP
jgi:hypothetical protein